jgi:hypothetical protein
MANDREFIIQPLITEGRVVKLSDIDPTTTYAQIGVWQPNQQQSGSPGNAFPSYVIPLSELGGTAINNKNFIGVDPVYGNDTQAIADGKYNPNSAFRNLDVAVANAASNDVIVLYPGTHITFGIFNPVCSFYGLAGSVISNPYGGSVFTLSNGVLNIEGDSVLYNVGNPVVNASLSTVNIKCR